MFHDKYKNRRNVLAGLQLENPAVFIPWEIEATDLLGMFEDKNISQITENGYWIKEVTVWGEDKCSLGVEFYKTIKKIGISRMNYGAYDNYVKSFEAFQVALIKEFGQPSERERILLDFENCKWKIDGKINIHHYVINRFGLEEHLYIERI